jgi:hypothetical protein
MMVTKHSNAVLAQLPLLFKKFSLPSPAALPAAAFRHRGFMLLHKTSCCVRCAVPGSAHARNMVVILLYRMIAKEILCKLPA